MTVMPLRKIVVASRNQKKVGEIRDLLAPHEFEIVCVADLPDVPDVIEDGDSFASNAAKKATQTASFLNEWTLGEDSGLEVDTLGGAPGIYSARYSGENATDDKNNTRLMTELTDIPTEKRTARYVCHIAISDPQGNIQINVEAYCRGWITTEPHGTNGFGYDPYFFIPEYHKTFGQLDPAVKRVLSHRARAFGQLIPQLVALKSSTVA